MERQEQRSADGEGPAPTRLARGTSQTGLRLYNERLVLSLIRRHGALPKAEIARLTGLSAQTISVIMKQLDADRLVRREAPVRGRVGQPSVPYALNKDGVFSVGLKIGRRTADLVLMNFVGEFVGARHQTYAYPTAEDIRAFVGESFAALTNGATTGQAERISGLGVAMPSELWSWADELGAPAGAMDAWRGFDVNTAFDVPGDLPIYVCNDATAACGAELVFGVGADLPDFLYFFVGTFVGGGLVLGGNLYPGKRGNAAALGSMLLPNPDRSGAPSKQLIQSASIYRLEKRLADLGLDPSYLWEAESDWTSLGPPVDDWIDEVAHGLAFAIVAAVSVIDLDTVVIDGAFPAAIRARLVEHTGTVLATLDRQGLLPVALIEGTIGDRARVLGAASLPLMANFTRDSELLFKDQAEPATGAGRRG